MKYFTEELWSKAESQDKQEREKASDEWNKITKEYLLVFDKIKSRLPKKFLKVFLESQYFHDYSLLGFNIKQTTGKKGNPQSVQIDIETPYDVRYTTRKYRITYLHPTKIVVKYDNHIGYNGFSDYICWELLPIDNKTLSHEIRFFSGATILIHFKDKNISVEELD